MSGRIVATTHRVDLIDEAEGFIEAVLDDGDLRGEFDLLSCSVVPAGQGAVVALVVSTTSEGRRSIKANAESARLLELEHQDF